MRHQEACCCPDVPGRQYFLSASALFVPPYDNKVICVCVCKLFLFIGCVLVKRFSQDLIIILKSDKTAA